MNINVPLLGGGGGYYGFSQHALVVNGSSGWQSWREGVNSWCIKWQD